MKYNKEGYYMLINIKGIFGETTMAMLLSSLHIGITKLIKQYGDQQNFKNVKEI
jgi:hypothetical protein